MSLEVLLLTRQVMVACIIRGKWTKGNTNQQWREEEKL